MTAQDLADRYGFTVSICQACGGEVLWGRRKGQKKPTCYHFPPATGDTPLGGGETEQRRFLQDHDDMCPEGWPRT